MPNKTTQILKEFREKFVLDLARVLFGDPEELKKQGWEVGPSHLIIKQDAKPEEIEKFITEALAQQQQEDYQEVLDLELMKDEDEHYSHWLPSEDGKALFKLNVVRNEFRKELRKAIAEKRGKV